MANQKKSPKPTVNFGAKLKTFIKTNYKILLFVSIFLILNLVFLTTACAENGIGVSRKFFILAVVVTIIASIAACIFLFFTKKKAWPIEKIFLVVGSILGIMYLLIIPMGRAPDEPIHFWRVYSISEGKILTEKQDGISGNYLPKNVTEFSTQYNAHAYGALSEKLLEPASEERVFFETIGSNPIDHLPQITGMAIGNLFHLPVLLTLYLSRLFGLITCIAIIYFCLKYIPILKKPLFFISCLPLTMQSFSTITYDGFIFCSAIALITTILYFIYHPTIKFKLPHYLFLTFACIVLTAVKPFYFPICLLLFFIPTSCFKNKKQKIILIITILLIVIGTFMLWSLLSTVSKAGNGADPGAQIHYILSNPIRYGITLAQNSIGSPSMHLAGLGQLEWLDVHTSDFYVIATLIVFTLLCVNEYINPTVKNQIKKSFQRWSIVLAIASIACVFSALYIQWSKVGDTYISGIQTRYFIPLLIIAPLACIPFARQSSTSSSNKNLVPSLYLYSFVIFLNFNALAVLLCTHI